MFGVFRAISPYGSFRMHTANTPRHLTSKPNCFWIEEQCKQEWGSSHHNSALSAEYSYFHKCQGVNKQESQAKYHCNPTHLLYAMRPYSESWHNFLKYLPLSAMGTSRSSCLWQSRERRHWALHATQTYLS